jgi:KDO2-lipid IV(A) lauroyltransferase
VSTKSPSASAPGLGGRLAYIAFWLIGSLPLRWLHRLGGWLGGRQRGRAWHITLRNLEMCFPELDDAQRRALAEETMRESGRSMLEAFRIWTRPRRALQWIREVEGGELLVQARAQGRGVLVLAPHLGAWELLNLYLAGTGPGAVLYRPPSSAAVEAAIVRSRGALGMDLIRADKQAPRTLIRRLAAGDLIGILPDQQPKIGEGVFAPFFGVEALTMTLAPRIAQRCVAVFGCAERLPGSAGFRIRFVPAPEGLYEEDPVRATAAMNATIEAMVRRAPAQYAWTYKRFSRRPPGEAPRYGANTRRRRNA